MLLHRREAHRVVAGELGDALLAVDRAANDVAPRGIGQRAEDAVEVGAAVCINTTIRLYIAPCQPGDRCNPA